MKRKYYLRGLAVGIVLTTVILTIANADNRPMTDAEVRQRALELGMIESDSLKLSDVGESSESYNPSIYMVESGGIDGETVGEEISTPVSESETNESAASSTAEATESAETTTPGESEGSESGEPVIITIKSGESSYTVSKALAAAGLVADAVEYDNYLCNYGYSRKICTGTYEIMPGMTYEEIAQMISH